MAFKTTIKNKTLIKWNIIKIEYEWTVQTRRQDNSQTENMLTPYGKF